MGTFVIKSSKVNKTFELTSEALVVNGAFSLDEQSNELQAINGSCYRNNQGQQGDFVGSFNGYARENGEIRYSISEMSRRDGMSVLDAIDEIEQNIINANE